MAARREGGVWVNENGEPSTIVVGPGGEEAATAAPGDAITVDGVATPLATTDTGRVLVSFVNVGPVTVWIGSTDGVTTANGIPVEMDEAFDDYMTTGEWWGITEGADTDIRRIVITRT